MQMADNLLEIEGLNKHFGGIAATDDLSLSIKRGEVHAIIGPNGAGKTTLIAQLSGMLTPDSGVIRFNDQNITRHSASARSHLGIARSFQITSIFRDFTCQQNVALAVQAHSGHSFKFWRVAKTDPVLQQPALEMLSQTGLGERADVLAGDLAHGEQRQLEIAMALATNPKLLLLDEPTAGMGAEDSQSMIAFLKTLKRKYTFVLIEHDMDAVFSLADRITVLVYGRAIATGIPEEIRNNELVKQAYLG